MDYHVFLLSRIREHYDHTANNRESVAVGLQSTAKIITGAALIMVVVFGGFAMGDLVMMQQMGFGLAIAVFLDATVYVSGESAFNQDFFELVDRYQPIIVAFVLALSFVLLLLAFRS
ncbi:MAG TPA: MMPL family transporter, partial [Longimicrobium sp.]|nr:MMPL family transporter [Longimicrobium sp.]